MDSVLILRSKRTLSIWFAVQNLSRILSLYLKCIEFPSIIIIFSGYSTGLIFHGFAVGGILCRFRIAFTAGGKGHQQQKPKRQR